MSEERSLILTYIYLFAIKSLSDYYYCEYKWILTATKISQSAAFTTYSGLTATSPLREIGLSTLVNDGHIVYLLNDKGHCRWEEARTEREGIKRKGLKIMTTISASID